MFRISVTDLRTSQTDIFSADAEKVLAIRKMLTPSKGETSKAKSDKDVTLLMVAPSEFENVVRTDLIGNRIVEDVKFIEHMNGQRTIQLRREDTFTPNSPDVHEVGDGEYGLKIHLDPAKHGGKRVRMIKLVPKD